MPTYAHAYLSGKTRVAPVNLNLSNSDGTTFGDDNSFSLRTASLTSKPYPTTNQLQGLVNELIYKSCSS